MIQRFYAWFTNLYTSAIRVTILNQSKSMMADQQGLFCHSLEESLKYCSAGYNNAPLWQYYITDLISSRRGWGWIDDKKKCSVWLSYKSLTKTSENFFEFLRNVRIFFRCTASSDRPALCFS